jgi:hypothetical protein
VVTPPPAFDGPGPINCGTVFEWGSGLVADDYGDRTATEARAVEEACHAAAQPDWTFFLTLLTVTILLLLFFVLAVWKANSRNATGAPIGLANQS